MQIGVFVPNVGPSANPAAMIREAQHAEALGFDSIWVADRLLFPLAPRSAYPATPDGVLPRYYQRILDPLTALTFLAAHTSRVALGTCILDIPFYNPFVVGRTLASLDVLSGGRLKIGCGQGWSEDEFTAVGLPAKGRGARTSEFLDALHALWSDDPVEFHGAFFDLPRSIIGLKPIQKPRPPVYLAAFSPAALQRAATKADGWMPARVPTDDLARRLAECRTMASEAGRDPARFALQVVAIPEITPSPIRGARALHWLARAAARGRGAHARDRRRGADLPDRSRRRAGSGADGDGSRARAVRLSQRSAQWCVVQVSLSSVRTISAPCSSTYS